MAEQPERPDPCLWARIVAQQQVAEEALTKSQQRKQRREETSRAAFATCERACSQQRTLLRELENLKRKERVMYELEHAKDQVMTVLKLALANLVMWCRFQRKREMSKDFNASAKKVHPGSTKSST